METRHLEPEPGLILVEYEDVPMTLRERPGRSPELLMWTEAGPRDPFPSATTAGCCRTARGGSTATSGIGSARSPRSSLSVATPRHDPARSPGSRAERRSVG